MEMRKVALYAVTSLLVACGGGGVSDPAAALPGVWACDDGIVLTIASAGRFEWRVPPGAGPQVGFGTESSDQHRVETDGGYSLLGPWRFAGGTLELDMMGDTDRYQVSFSSSSSMTLAGPDQYSCNRR